MGARDDEYDYLFKGKVCCDEDSRSHDLPHFLLILRFFSKLDVALSDSLLPITTTSNQILAMEFSLELNRIVVITSG